MYGMHLKLGYVEHNNVVRGVAVEGNELVVLLVGERRVAPISLQEREGVRRNPSEVCLLAVARNDLARIRERPSVRTKLWC
jgi:hypothetical protein